LEPEGRIQPEFRAESLAAIAALRSALALVQARRGASDVQEKGPFDLVTATDVRAQAAIESSLRDACPGLAFVGEEGGDAYRIAARRYWLVDPICGTGNYAADIPLYAINIALVEDDHVTCGAIADGATGDLFVAERGRGAWLVGGGRLRATSASRLLSVDPHARGPDPLARFSVAFAQAALVDSRWDARIFSTTLVLPYIATGRLAAAVYASLGSPVHFAAGLLLAQEAGAVITDGSGQPWTLASDIYVIAGDLALHASVLALARSVWAISSSPNT
jgi:myo-inositol-1(or 4)-monophosphatase